MEKQTISKELLQNQHILLSAKVIKVALNWLSAAAVRQHVCGHARTNVETQD